jgi:hypothetical protein
MKIHKAALNRALFLSRHCPLLFSAKGVERK